MTNDRGASRRFSSPLGEMLMASDGDDLTGLWFVGQRYFPEIPFEERDLPVFERTAEWLEIYFRGGIPDVTPPLRLYTTEFRRSVLEVLTEVPYGQTVTYGELADRLARQKGIARVSARAVGGAVGHNPISLIIPCHRVIGTGGSLTGYAGGLDRKQKLLELEAENKQKKLL